MTEAINKDQPRLDDLISLHEAAEMSGLSHDHLLRLAGQVEIWDLVETLKYIGLHRRNM